MLEKKIWMLILIVLFAVIGFCIFYGRSVENKAPVKIYKPVEVETTKPTETEESVTDTATQGHFHEDGTFHAEPHEKTTQPTRPPSVIAQGTPTSDRISEMLSSEAAKIALSQQLKEQYLKDSKAWWEIFAKAHAERLQVVEEGKGILPPAGDRSYDYVKHLSDAEKREIVAQLKAYMERYEAASEKEDAIFQARPVWKTPPQKK